MGSSRLYVGVFVVILVLWCSFAEAEQVKCRGCILTRGGCPFSRNKPAVPDTLTCVFVDWRKGFPPCLVKEVNKRPTTTTLSLQMCKLTTLSPGAFIGLTSIQTLSIAFTNIKKLDRPNVFEGLENLKVLSLFNNAMEEIHPAAFSGLGKVYELDMASNKLQVLQKSWLESLPSLLFLTLRSNRISTLEKDVFSNSPRLKKVDLTWNKLSTLPPFVFSNLKHLQKLELGANRIVSLPSFAFAGLESNQGLKITLKGNPMVCNKEMCSWLMEVRHRLKDSSCVFLFQNRTEYKKANLASDTICSPVLLSSGFANGRGKATNRGPLVPMPGRRVD